MSPLARILSIGDELVLGRTIDTNATHIARWLTDRGFAVDRVQAVGDGQAAIAAALGAAAAGAAVVVCSGGLGPTDDDRTRHALAEAMGVDLIERDTLWRGIVAAAARVRPGMRVPAVNRRQALVPEGARALANDRGTAPGLFARLHGCHVACLPGVPHEMRAMLDRLAPRLARLFPRLAPPAIGEVWIAGIGESTAQELIGDLLIGDDPQVGITVGESGHITLRAVGRRARVAARVRALRRALRPHLLPAAGIAPSLVAELARRRLTITTAESCTCGLIAAGIGAVPGASSVLRRAMVTYHVDEKAALLGIDPAFIRRVGVVSAACATAMAEGARHAAGADLAVASTGVAGPGGGTRAHPPGTVWLAVADRRGCVTRLARIRGDRERVQRRGAVAALLLAWERLTLS